MTKSVVREIEQGALGSLRFEHHFFGEDAKKLIAAGVAGDFQNAQGYLTEQGVVFQFKTRSVEGRDVVDMEMWVV